MMPNIEPDIDKMFVRLVIKVGIIVLIIFILWFAFSSCNVFSALKKDSSTNTEDSVNLKKQTESLIKLDTTKTKTESVNTKETVYYPQPIIVPGKDGETKVIFVPQSTKETGTNKEEKQNFNYEQYAKEKIDSTKLSELEKQLSKQSEVKGSVLGFGFWVGLALVGLVLIGIMVMLLKFKSQIGLLTKKINHGYNETSG